MTGTDHWARATAGLPAPLVAVDLDAFDANADDLVRRAGGLPIRVASKSVRCRTLLDRVLARPGFAGVMAYAVPEAVWLVGAGVRDVFVAYPSVDEAALRAVATDDLLRAEVTVTIDSVEHVRWLRDTLGDDVAGLGVALDCDASLRVGRVHLGVRRSPTRDGRAGARRGAGGPRGRARRAGRDVLRRPGRRTAGCRAAHPHDEAALGARAGEQRRRGRGDGGARRDRPALRQRAAARAACTGSGTTGSSPSWRPGSGLYAPTLFDGYDDFDPRPAMAFALPVVRRPAPGYVTAFGGGYVSSGEPGWSRVPSPVRRGLSLVRTEATGEVQTPLHGEDADGLEIGDRVWMRGAKAGELLERFDAVHLVAGGELVGTVPSYRGEGRNFG